MTKIVTAQHILDALEQKATSLDAFMPGLVVMGNVFEYSKGRLAIFAPVAPGKGRGTKGTALTAFEDHETTLTFTGRLAKAEVWLNVVKAWPAFEERVRLKWFDQEGEREIFDVALALLEAS